LEKLVMLKDIYKDKTVLITGDTGFKGSWLAIWLIHLGAKVVGFSLPPIEDNSNYIITGLEERLIHVNGDIRDYNQIFEVIQDYEPDFIFHLAAQALVLESYLNPLNTFQTNVLGTVNLLESVRNTNSVQVIVNITSDKCYENNEWTYGYREIDKLGGKDPYSASKGASEIVSSSYLRSFFNLDSSTCLATARAGNVIGGGDWATGRIIPDCIRALLNNEPIKIRNPHSRRPWQYVLEPLYGYLILGENLFKHGHDYAGAWNFGPNISNNITVEELVKLVIDKWGVGKYINELNQQQNKESINLYLDISKASTRLKWNPAISAEDMVSLTIDEYKTENMSKNEIFEQRTEHVKKYIDLQEKMESRRLSLGSNA
jgi:CDP-glucose 4,6-dehydratase